MKNISPPLLCVSAESHQVLAQLLDTLLVIGTQLPESPAVRQRLIEMACKVTNTHTHTHTHTQFVHSPHEYRVTLATKLSCVFSLLSAPVGYVFRGEEQMSEASGMSRHGGRSADQRQRGAGHIVRSVSWLSTAALTDTFEI